MVQLETLFKVMFVTFCGYVGWLVGEFQPTFPLMIVAIVFIVYDAWTAFRLDKRVHKRYPDKTSREKAKFTSFAFGKVVKKTIPTRLWLIVLTWVAQHWVFTAFTDAPMVYIITGVICGEQFLSILENESSCRDNADESRLWRLLRNVLVDKTERHFDIDLGELKNKDKEEENHGKEGDA